MSEDARCSATLTAPAQDHVPGPCIVMAGGLGSERHIASPPYARVFGEAGYRVLSFDYRGWGDSEGEPRHLVSMRRQLADWAAAVAFARTLPGVNANQIALWGSSMSGGHVIVTAARDPRIAAVSAQCPMMDGLAASTAHLRSIGLIRGLQVGWLAARDLLNATFRMPPVTIQIDGSPDELALMSSWDVRSGMDRLLADAGEPSHPRFAPARIALELGRYRPITSAPDVRCPTLIIACENDSVAPYASAVATKAAIGEHARLISCGFGHFSIYVDDGFKFSSSHQLAFFDEVFSGRHSLSLDEPRQMQE